MAEKTGKRIDRAAENARSVVEPALYALYLLAFGLFAFLVYHYDSSLPWRLAVVAVGAMIAFRIFERSNFAQVLSDRAAGNAVAWTVISIARGAAGGIRAAFAWLFTTPPFRLFARLAALPVGLARPLLAGLALPLAIVLTAALTYRLAVLPALIARGSEASGFDLLVVLGDWLLFGSTYGLIGIAAPLITLLLLLRRRGSSLGLAALLHGVALVGTCLTFGLGLSRSGFAIFDPFPPGALVFHPIFAAPEASVLVRDLYAAEALGGFLALYLIMRPQVRRHYRFPNPEEPGAAVIAFGLVVVQSKVIWVGYRMLWALTDLAARNDAAGAGASKVLGAMDRARAVFTRLRDIPPVRRLGQAALLLALILAATIAGWPQPQP